MSSQPPPIPAALLHRRTTHIPHDSQVLIKLPSDKIKPVLLKSNSNSIPFDEKFRNRVSSKLPTVSGTAEKEFEKKLQEEQKLKEKEEKEKERAKANPNNVGGSRSNQKDPKGKGKQAENPVEMNSEPKESDLQSNGQSTPKKSNQEVKTIASLGKFGSFDTSQVVGLPFGHTFEISDLDPKDPKALKVVMSGSLEELGELKLRARSAEGVV